MSNMSNSGVGKVAALTQYNSRSLRDHLMSSKWWDFGRKQGGLYVFTPTRTAENSDWYRGTADSIAQNLEFLKDSHEPYVVIASGDCVYKMDYNKVLEYHIAKKADITVVCKEFGNDVNVERFGCVKTDDDGRICEFEEKPVKASSHTISCGIYVIRRRQLIEMIEKAAEENRYDFVSDILIRYKDLKRIYAYKMTEYWKNVSTIQDYYDTNMDFLKPDIRNYFFRQYPLVDNGVLVENAPKGKSIRKALCDRDGEIMVVMSQTPESFHDFAQALVDLQVDNAIYLVGSTSFGYFRDYYDQLEIIYNKLRYGYQYENFIVWR